MISANRTQGGCLSSDLLSCAGSRGGFFNINILSTWADQGLYALEAGDNLPNYPGSQVEGEYGDDSIMIDPAGSNEVLITTPSIAAIASTDYYLGTLGLSISDTYLDSSNEWQITPFLRNAEITQRTQRRSYAYSAGARYSKNIDQNGAPNILLTIPFKGTIHLQR